MTKENAKRLYEHYVATGQEARAADVLSRHPDLKAAPVEKAAPKAKSK